jgi:hydroxymethylpyrimidine pyrophosphatase-like HAD family hydrolase
LGVFTMRQGNTKPFDPPRVIAVDVDGTLAIGGALNTRLVELLKARKEEGFRLMLWSMRGEAHARRVAEGFGVAGMFDHIAPKPGYVVDDEGWRWTSRTRVLVAG